MVVLERCGYPGQFLEMDGGNLVDIVAFGSDFIEVFLEIFTLQYLRAIDNIPCIESARTRTLAIIAVHHRLDEDGSIIVILIVELKQVKSLEKFLKILRLYADVSMCVVVSFSTELIERMAALAPDIMRAVITNTGVKNADEVTRSTHSVAIGMALADLDNDVIANLHKGETMVFVWDCTDAESVRRALAFDIDGIISDVPDVVNQESINSMLDAS